MSPKGLKYILHLIGRKIFKREHGNEVEYGQTLSKKRRKNCILKSVSSLSEETPEMSNWVDAPYRIKFEFTSDDREFRGSVLNFQKIDPADVCCLRNCCDKCFCTMASRSSVSSDSACEVTSGSSCGDYDCAYSRSRVSGSVEDFIRIHNEHFLKDWDADEPDYETLPRRGAGPKSECDYDILLSKTNCNVLEPSYENLKLVENFYETPKNISVCPAATLRRCSDCCAVRKIKDLVQANKTYDEVIESLKVLHSSAETGKPDSCKCVAEGGDNDINDYLENCKSYENDNNNDFESVSFQY